MKRISRKPRACTVSGASPQLLARALQAQGDGVVLSAIGVSAEAQQIVFANEAFCAMSGHSLPALLQMPPWKLHVDADDFEKIERWQRAGKTGRPLSGEGYLLRHDGSTFYAAWTVAALLDVRGRPAHLVLTYRDNTERRRLQEALVHAQRLDAVGRLAGGVAHDFNNLLSVINGYCEMLTAEVSDRPRALREVNEIHQAGLRAASLTRHLLAFGRRQPADPRVVNLNRILQESAPILSRLIGDAGKLDLDLADKLANVRIDPTQFQQVLLNLIINARDALRDHGRITLTTRTHEIRPGQNRRTTDAPPGRYVALEVMDNGTGMDAETQRHLFEPFFTTKPEGKGTGLGLALVYGVVQQSSGFINVRSALLAGSTFEILLPETKEPEEETALVPPAPLPVTRGHESLLLVEHNEVVLKMVAGMLTADGYRVTALRSAREALARCRDTGCPVQLLIAGTDDLSAKLAFEIHQRTPSLRLLRVGNLDAPAAFAWMDAKQQAGLAKPFALSELLRTVRALLDA